MKRDAYIDILMIRYRLFFGNLRLKKRKKNGQGLRTSLSWYGSCLLCTRPWDQSKHVIRAIMVHTGIPALGRQSRRPASDLRDPYLKNIRLSRIES